MKNTELSKNCFYINSVQDEHLAAFIQGEMLVLGTLNIDGELLNNDGGMITNMGK